MTSHFAFCGSCRMQNWLRTLLVHRSNQLQTCRFAWFSSTKKEGLNPLGKTWAGVDSNHRTLARTDLQSVAFSHSATYPYSIFKFFSNLSASGFLKFALDETWTRDLSLTKGVLYLWATRAGVVILKESSAARILVFFIKVCLTSFRKTCMSYFFIKKAGNGTRTYNLRFTKPLLCQLSYTGTCW